MLAVFEADPKVPPGSRATPTKGLVDEETYDPKVSSWTVKIWWGKAGEIAEGRVDDASGVVTEAWTGPQVAWKMGRGYKGAFGGDKINDPWIWGAFCLVFLIGLADFRRPLSLRNLDLLMLLSPTASLWYFNHGNIFTAVPFFYPALAWVVVRGVWIGITGRGSPDASGVVGLDPDRRDRVSHRIPRRAQLAGLERDRRRLLGRDRRRADRARPGAVGQLPDRGKPEGLRAGRRRG